MNQQPIGDPPEFIELNNSEFYVSTKTYDGKSEIYGNPVIMTQGLMKAWQATKIFEESSIDKDWQTSDKIEKCQRRWWKSKRRVV
jgi:hypothetical protein